MIIDPVVRYDDLPLRGHTLVRGTAFNDYARPGLRVGDASVRYFLRPRTQSAVLGLRLAVNLPCNDARGVVE